jgi:hypothetical protein
LFNVTSLLLVFSYCLLIHRALSMVLHGLGLTFALRFDTSTLRQVNVGAGEDNVKRTSTKPPFMNFKTVVRAAVPQGRKGKHRLIVSRILADLHRLEDGAALKIPLDELGDTKPKVRSALNRATRKAALNVATATDAGYLYVWNERHIAAKSATETGRK